MKGCKKNTTSEQEPSADRRQWTPTQGLFLLKDVKPLRTMRLGENEWLGVYQGPMPGGELLHASRSPLALYRKLKRNPKQEETRICWPVSAMRAASKEKLLKPLISNQRDHSQQLRRSAFAAIAEARKRIENDAGLFTETEVKTAKDFLKDLSNEARKSGGRRGDKPQAAENQKMLRVFLWLSQGKTLKQITIEEKGSKHYERKMRTLSVLIKRFSQRVHAAFCSHCGSVPASIVQDGAHENCWGYLSSLFGSIERWPGVKSNCREHGYALCEALRYLALGKAKRKPC